MALSIKQSRKNQSKTIIVLNGLVKVADINTTTKVVTAFQKLTKSLSISLANFCEKNQLTLLN